MTLNLAVGGDWPGSPKSAIAQSVYIDYVRVYQDTNKTVTPIPVRPISANTSSSSSGLSMTTLIAIIVVVVILIIALIILRYLYTYILRKRALSDAPLPEFLAAKASDHSSTSKIQYADDASENSTSMMEEGNNQEEEEVVATPVSTKMPVESSAPPIKSALKKNSAPTNRYMPQPSAPQRSVQHTSTDSRSNNVSRSLQQQLSPKQHQSPVQQQRPQQRSRDESPRAATSSRSLIRKSDS
jgi:FtsZ-interacting cell division protein ZipA